VSAAGHLDELRHGVVALLLVEGGISDRRGAVWSFSPEMISIGPRSGFMVSTLASVHGLRFAAAAWKIGTPDAGTA